MEPILTLREIQRYSRQTLMSIIKEIYPDYKFSIFHDIDIDSLKNKEMYNDINIFNRNILLYSISYGECKFNSLKHIIYNPFLTEEQKENAVKYFCNIQRVYRALCKFAYLYKLRKVKKYDYDNDLLGEPLSELSDKLKIDIIEDKTKYTFRISDLLNIINQALCNAPEMFAEPLQIKNPYTNLKFKKFNLYNIYFKTLNSSYTVPQLFYSFFHHGFKLRPFLQENESVIRNISIKKYIQNNTDTDIARELHQMIRRYRRYLPRLRFLKISHKLLIKEFKHMLEYYLRVKYSLNGYDREMSERKLIIELNQYNSTKINSLHLQIEQELFNKAEIVPLSPRSSNSASDDEMFVFGHDPSESNEEIPEYFEEMLLSIDISGAITTSDISNNIIQRIIEMTNRMNLNVNNIPYLNDEIISNIYNTSVQQIENINTNTSTSSIISTNIVPINEQEGENEDSDEEVIIEGEYDETESDIDDYDY